MEKKNQRLEKTTIVSKTIMGFLLLFIIACNSASEKAVKPSIKNENTEIDNWEFMGIGGGGAMFHQCVSPHNPLRVLVACDMGGSFITHNGGISWRQFNLPSKSDFFAFDPLDSLVMYAKSVGLYKSSNKGDSWELVYPNLENVDKMIAVGDHAADQLVLKDSMDHVVLAMAIDPKNSKVLNIAVRIKEDSTVLMQSTNAGHSWTKVNDIPNDIIKLYVDPFSPVDNRKYLIGCKSGIATLTGNQLIKNKLPQDIQSINDYTFGYDKILKKYWIYAITGTSYFNSNQEKAAILYTQDDGQHWQDCSGGITQMVTDKKNQTEWRAIATSEYNPHVIYVSYANLVIQDTTCIGVAKSEDYGKTWKLVWKDIFTKQGSKSSSNMGPDWLNDRYGPYWGENPFSIGVSPVNVDVCFTGDFGRTLKTEDGGDSWQQVNSTQTKNGWTSTGLEVSNSYQIAFDPFDSNHLFIPSTDIGLLESTDRGKSWLSATQDNGVPEHWINTTYWMEFDPAVKGKVWAVNAANHDLPRPKMFRKDGINHYEGGVMVSEDGGKNWTPVSKDIGEAAVTHLLLDTTSNINARILYVCAFGKGVYKSEDGGKSWKQKNKGINLAEPFAWRLTRRPQDGSLFLVVSRRSEDGSIGNAYDGALYVSRDGAESWTKLNLPKGTNGPTTLVIDETDPKQLLLSAWGMKSNKKHVGDIGGGIFLSKDEGASWQNVLDSDQHISSITYDQRSKTYFATGFGAGAYTSVDGGKNWSRIPGFNFKWSHRVEPDLLEAGKIYINTFGGGVWHGNISGDPSSIEDLEQKTRQKLYKTK